MPGMELHEVHIKILALADKGPIYRGLFGWPGFIQHDNIRRMADSGYLRLFYDWEKDKVLVKLTGLGRSRYEQIIEANLQPLD